MPTLNMFPRFARGSLSMGPSSKKQMHILEGRSAPLGCPAGDAGGGGESVSARRGARLSEGTGSETWSLRGAALDGVSAQYMPAKDAAQKLGPTRTAFFFAFHERSANVLMESGRPTTKPRFQSWRRLLASWAAWRRAAIRDRQCATSAAFHTYIIIIRTHSCIGAGFGHAKLLRP